MSTWGTVDPLPRLAILDVMPADGKRVSVTWIAKAVVKNAGTVDQMLHAMKADKLVDCSSERGFREWWRTEVPVPEKFTSTANAKVNPLYDDSALREALGVPAHAPIPRGATIVRRK